MKKNNKNWIPKNLKKGAFTQWCKKQGFSGVTEECINRGLKSKNKTTQARAKLARAFRNMNNKKAFGGTMNPFMDLLTMALEKQIADYATTNDEVRRVNAMLDPFYSGNPNGISAEGIMKDRFNNSWDRLFGNTYATGGEIEVEGGEVIDDGNNVTEVSGPNHEQGGVKLNPYVYSKRLKVDGKTIADRKKYRERKIMSYQKKINDNPFDRFLQGSYDRTKQVSYIEELIDRKVQGTINSNLNTIKNITEKVYSDTVEKMATGGDINYTPPKTYIPPSNTELLSLLGINSSNSFNDEQFKALLDELPSGDKRNITNYVKYGGMSYKDAFAKNFNVSPDEIDSYIKSSDFFNKYVKGEDLQQDNDQSNINDVYMFNKDFFNTIDNEEGPNTWEEDFPLTNNWNNNKQDTEEQQVENNEQNYNKETTSNKINNTGEYTNYNAITEGDIVGILGNTIAGTSPLITTLANKQKDRPFYNYYKDFGKNSLDTLDKTSAQIMDNMQEYKKDINLAENTRLRQSRLSAWNVNTQRALDENTYGNTLRSVEKLNRQTNETLANIGTSKANLESQIDRVVMAGEEQADLRNRQQTDNFYTQLGTNLSEVGYSLQNTAKALNDINYNNTVLNLINQISPYGFKVDKNGNIIKTDVSDMDPDTMQTLITLLYGLKS